MEALGVEGDILPFHSQPWESTTASSSARYTSWKSSDLDKNNLVELSRVFSTPTFPVSKESIPKQSDVHKFPNLKGIQMPEINADIGLLIGNDAPKALEPKEVRQSKARGLYTTRTVFG